MHSVISMPWHNTVRAAEEYDEYVFGTEQKEMEERRELKEGAEEGGDEERGEERSEGRKKRDVPNDFRNWQKNSNPITAAGPSFVSICLCFSLFLSASSWWQITLVRAKSGLKVPSLYEGTVAAGKSVYQKGSLKHITPAALWLSYSNTECRRVLCVGWVMLHDAIILNSGKCSWRRSHFSCAAFGWICGGNQV